MSTKRIPAARQRHARQRIRALAAGLLLPTTAWMPAPAAPGDGAQGRPIRIIVPFPPGGNADLVARAYAQPMSRSLGQAIIIENRPGAGGALGLAAAAKARPDGATLVLSDVGTQVANVLAIPDLPYDPGRDFVPIARLTSVSLLLVAHPALGLSDVHALIALAKSRPGKLSFASAGGATPSRFAMELLRAAAGIDMLHVPYKGAGPALVDVIGGQVDTMFDGGAAPLVQAGKLRLLAVSGDRNPAFPDMPTLAESGLPQAFFSSWHGFFAPAGTPGPLVGRLAEAVEQAGRSAELRNALGAIGIAVHTQRGSAFEHFIADQTQRLGSLVKAGHIRFE